MYIIYKYVKTPNSNYEDMNDVVEVPAAHK
jgi:hypothetical protein